jgi:hypothetical protein
MRSALVPILFGQANAILLFDPVNGRYQVGAQRYSNPADMPGWSFSRASAGMASDASGNVVSFASGAPRITSRGLLIELAATNLLLWSQAFTNAAWVASNVTVTDNTAVAPDGTTTMATISDGVATGNHILQQLVSVTSGLAYTMGVFVKAGTAQWIQLVFSTNGFSGAKYRNFDLVNGVQGAGTASATITEVGSAWPGVYYITYTDTATATVAAGFDIFMIAADGTGRAPSTTGANRTAFIWQADLQQASTLSSPIFTTSAAGTRAADQGTLTYGGSPSTATLTYATSSTASPSPVSPLNFGASSGGAWVGNYIRSVVVQ